MRVSEGIEVLSIEMALASGTSVLHPTVLRDDAAGVTLIDAGLPGALEPLGQALEAAGTPLAVLRRIIVTHQDIDHIGGLPEILAAVGQRVEVLAHAADRPYIEGELRPIKFDPKRLKGMLEQLPADRRAALERLLLDPPKAPVDRTLDDGDELPILGGLRVVATPGHTPGHICLYHPASKTLIAGDAVVVEDGRVRGPNPRATPDMERAMASVRKLAALDITTLVAYHGGVVTRGVGDQLRELSRGA